MADFCTSLHSLFRLFSSSVIREGSHQPMSEAGRKLGACGVLRVAACVRWPRRRPAVGVQCKSGQAALAINIATTSLQCINESTKRAEPPALAALPISFLLAWCSASLCSFALHLVVCSGCCLRACSYSGVCCRFPMVIVCFLFRSPFPPHSPFSISLVVHSMRSSALWRSL